MPKFMTIRQVARAGIWPEHRQRIMLKRGELPGVYSGSRFMVNVDALEKLLDAQTAQSVQQDSTEQPETA